MSENDMFGTFYEKQQKHRGFSLFWRAPGSPGIENPAARATNSSPDENSLRSFYCTKGADITSNHAGKRAFRNPAACATAASPDENSFHSFYCTKGAVNTFNHAGKRAFRNPSEPFSASTVWGISCIPTAHANKVRWNTQTSFLVAHYCSPNPIISDGLAWPP